MNYNIAKEMMIKNQLRPNQINESYLIDLFQKTSKEFFLPDKIKKFAYIDDEIELLNNRYYLSNLNIAQMLKYSDFNKNDNILHIGALTGYVSVLISKLVKQVYAIEQNQKLYKLLEENINKLKINNIKTLNYKHEEGYKISSSYDVIFIDSVIEEIPINLYTQLRNSNSKIIYLQKINKHLSHGIKLIKNSENMYKKKLFDSFSKSNSLFVEKIEFKF